MVADTQKTKVNNGKMVEHLSAKKTKHGTSSTNTMQIVSLNSVGMILLETQVALNKMQPEPLDKSEAIKLMKMHAA